MYVNGEPVSVTDALSEFTEVAEFGEYGYDWAIMKVYQLHFRLFALRASGCSCTDFDDSWDNPEEAITDMVELPTLEAAQRYYEEFRGEYYADVPKWLDVVERFRGLGLR